MYFRGLMGEEIQRYDEWRKNHSCVSQVEISYIPDAIDQATTVRCLLCGEKIEITDFSVG
jgi:hypothetical protein